VIKKPIGILFLVIICLFNLGFIAPYFLVSWFMGGAIGFWMYLFVICLDVLWIRGLLKGCRLTWKASIVQLLISFVVVVLIFTSLLSSILMKLGPPGSFIPALIHGIIIAILATGIFPTGLGVSIKTIAENINPNLAKTLENPTLQSYLILPLALVYTITAVYYLNATKSKYFNK